MRISDWSSDVCSSDLRQLVRAGDHWHERLVACQDTLFLPIGGPPLPADVIPEHLRDAPHGAVLETAPAAVAVMRALAARSSSRRFRHMPLRACEVEKVESLERSSQCLRNRSLPALFRSEEHT